MKFFYLLIVFFVIGCSTPSVLLVVSGVSLVGKKTDDMTIVAYRNYNGVKKTMSYSVDFTAFEYSVFFEQYPDEIVWFEEGRQYQKMIFYFNEGGNTGIATLYVEEGKQEITVSSQLGYYGKDCPFVFNLSSLGR